MRVRLLLLALCAALFNSACSERPSPLAAGPGPLALISDGSTGGNSHFFFLAPMVPEAGTAGANDESQSPIVVICAWDGAACTTTQATFTTDLSTTTTTQEGNSETVRLGANHFIVDWHTDAFGLDPALTYRVCVKVGDVGLGYADVDVAASGRELRVGVDGYVSVLDGRTLPIRFRIEAGALDEPVTSGCGTESPE